MSDAYRQHPRFARAYIKFTATADPAGDGLRERLVRGLSGEVIEIGAGNGLNFAYYPATVTHVLAVEPDDTMRDFAGRSAARAPVPTTVATGHADALPADDDSMDAAVTSLVLCSVPDPAHALAEIARVLRPGGELRFYEHVRSARYGRVQDLISPLWSATCGGCHPNRDTASAIEAAGFEMTEIDRFRYSPAKLPPTAHILGVARKPLGDTRANEV